MANKYLNMNLPPPRYDQPIPPRAKKVFKGEIFEVYQWKQKMFDGTTAVFEKLKRTDTALIIPVLPDKTIIISEQEQPNKPPYPSFLGGRVDKGEDPLSAAMRELDEESGYTSQDWHLLSNVQPVGKINWIVYTFVARNCHKTKNQKLDGGEKIELKIVSFEELIQLGIQHGFGSPEFRILALEAKIDPEKMTKLRFLILGD